MKRWVTLGLLAVVSAPMSALAADANLFAVHTFDRYNNGLSNDSNDLPGRLWVPPGPAPEGGYTFVTFFHGLGEVGSNGNRNVSQVNGNIDNLFAAAQEHGFILYAPQAWGGWGGQNYDMAAAQMAKVMKTYDVDPSQVYVTGLSNGGRGTWEMATLYDDVLAAAVPICGQMPNWSAGSTAARPAVLAELPIWAFHARNDGVVDVSHTRNGVNQIRAAKGLGAISFPSKNSYPPDYYPSGRHEYDDGLLRYTEHESGDHYIWGSVYARDEVYDWMLTQTNSNSPHLQLGETLRFDLGSNVASTDDSGRRWNSTNYALSLTSDTVIGFALTDEGRRTAVTLDVTSTFHGENTNTPPGLPAQGSDYWYVQNFSGGDNFGEVTLTGLTDGMMYDVELFASSPNPGTVRYTVNGIEATLAFQNNLSNTALVEGVLVSVDGTLTIEVEAVGATYAYLNWFTVTAVPEPTVALLLAPATALLLARRAERCSGPARRGRA